MEEEEGSTAVVVCARVVAVSLALLMPCWSQCGAAACPVLLVDITHNGRETRLLNEREREEVDTEQARRERAWAGDETKASGSSVAAQRTTNTQKARLNVMLGSPLIDTTQRKRQIGTYSQLCPTTLDETLTFPPFLTPFSLSPSSPSPRSPFCSRCSRPSSLPVVAAQVPTTMAFVVELCSMAHPSWFTPALVWTSRFLANCLLSHSSLRR